MLIGSLVELHVGLHSCLCFSHLKKLVLKAGSTPPQYLIDTLSSFFSFFLLQSQQLLDTWWIDREWVCILNSFSTPCGSIELLFLVLLGYSSTPPRHLSRRRPFSWHLPRQVSRCLSTLASIKIYYWHYLISLCDPELISFDLSLDTSLFSLSNFLISLQSLFLKDFSSFFKNFFTW